MQARVLASGMEIHMDRVEEAVNCIKSGFLYWKGIHHAQDRKRLLTDY
jgi:uncharacterized protein with PIN domain